MIKNDRQYRITKAEAAKFGKALRELESQPTPKDIDPVIAAAQAEALRTQLEDLRAEIKQYEDLLKGRVELIEVASLSELAKALIRARIASGLSQKELAERLALKEQQVQRYEATDYRQASLTRLVQVADALGVSVRKEFLLPTSDASKSKLLARLGSVGLRKDFVLNRLVPGRELDEGRGDRFSFDVLRCISHVFGWTPAAVLGTVDRPWLDAGVLGAARFKKSTAAEEKFLEVYTFYAHYLALLLVRMTEGMPSLRVPEDPAEVAEALRTKYGGITLEGAVKYCWDLGIPVLPLSDRGAFHGACWRVEGRNVIVLKQTTGSKARWHFALLHELRHAAEEPEEGSRTVVESEEFESVTSEEEQTASWYAGEVSLSGRAEELVDLCIRRADNRIERLKRIVPEVASEEAVDVGALANYLAFRLSLQGENWWGAAANLQGGDHEPFEIVRNELLRRVKLSLLADIDRDLLVKALEDVDDGEEASHET